MTIDRSPRSLLATMLVAAAGLVAFLGLAPAAQAGSSNYCGTTLGSSETCWGGARWLNAVGGSGHQHSVCVGSSAYANVTCSSGPGAFTYDPQPYGNYAPWIQNNAAGLNEVQGVAYFP
jgi:hypothetical protein